MFPFVGNIFLNSFMFMFTTPSEKNCVRYKNYDTCTSRILYLVAFVENLNASGQHILLTKFTEGLSWFVLTAAFISDAVILPALKIYQLFLVDCPRVSFSTFSISWGVTCGMCKPSSLLLVLFKCLYCVHNYSFTFLYYINNRNVAYRRSCINQESVWENMKSTILEWSLLQMAWTLSEWQALVLLDWFFQKWL